ncbi:hypothetical protein PENTCL1PPCAC_27591, partial [Pristionchus entomophagus]
MWMKEQPTTMRRARAARRRKPSQWVPEGKVSTLKKRNGRRRPDFRLCNPRRRQTTEKKSNTRINTWNVWVESQSAHTEKDEKGIEKNRDERETTDDTRTLLE